MIKNAKRNAQWTYVISDLNGEETVETFLGNCEKHIRKGLKPKSNQEKRKQITCHI